MIEEFRRPRQRGRYEEREDAVVPERGVAHGVQVVRAQPWQHPDQSPEHERAQERQDRFVPDRRLEVPRGDDRGDRADAENHLTHEQRTARQVQIREGSVEQ